MIEYFWSIPKLSRHIFALRAKSLLQDYIEKHGKPDILHAHFAFWGGVATEKLAKEFGIPYVITEQGTAYARNLYSATKFRRAISVFNHAATSICLTPSLAQNVSLRLGIENNFAIVPNAVDTDFFKLAPLTKKDKKFTFFALSNLVSHKALDFLIKSFYKAFYKDSEVQLLIGGDGPDRKRLESLCEELGLSRRIFFLGRLNREEARSYFHRAHAFVHPSDVETFGVVVIEAMASGLPVVSTICGGPEHIVTKESGYLVNCRDETQFSTALAQLRGSVDRFDAEKIRQYTIKRYSLKAVADQLLNIYNGIEV